jgi:hypothetical protein
LPAGTPIAPPRRGQATMTTTVVMAKMPGFTYYLNKDFPSDQEQVREASADVEDEEKKGADNTDRVINSVLEWMRGVEDDACCTFVLFLVC